MGVPMVEALGAFYDMASRADLLVAHHIAFDLKMIDIENAFLGRSAPFGLPEDFCTMKNSAAVVGIPYFRGGYKFPTLAEAIKGVLGKDVDDSDLHDAMVDTEFCAEIFTELHRLGLAP